MSRKIVAWSLCVVWDDKEEEVILDTPPYVSDAVDDFLNVLEQQENEDDKD